MCAGEVLVVDASEPESTTLISLWNSILGKTPPKHSRPVLDTKFTAFSSSCFKCPLIYPAILGWYQVKSTCRWQWSFVVSTFNSIDLTSTWEASQFRSTVVHNATMSVPGGPGWPSSKLEVSGCVLNAWGMGIWGWSRLRPARNLRLFYWWNVPEILVSGMQQEPSLTP